MTLGSGPSDRDVARLLDDLEGGEGEVSLAGLSADEAWEVYRDAAERGDEELAGRAYMQHLSAYHETKDEDKHD